MTTVIVIGVVFLLAGVYLIALGLCWSAAAGDRVQITRDELDAEQPIPGIDIDGKAA